MDTRLWDEKIQNIISALENAGYNPYAQMRGFLMSGDAVVYQNNWISPVLTMIDKANVEEVPYVNPRPSMIKPIRQARTEIIRAIMEPWLPGERIEFTELAKSLKSLNVSRESRKLLSVMLCTYRNHNGHMLWNENSMGLLQTLLRDILDLSHKELEEVIAGQNPDVLRRMVISKTNGFMLEEIDEICHVLIREEEL